MIRLILPDDAHDMLQAITSAVNAEDTLALRNLTLRIWAEAATRQKMRSLAELTRSLPPKTLLDRYEELPPRARERIDLLPPEDMFEEMTPNGPPR